MKNLKSIFLYFLEYPNYDLDIIIHLTAAEPIKCQGGFTPVPLTRIFIYPNLVGVKHNAVYFTSVSCDQCNTSSSKLGEYSW